MYQIQTPLQSMVLRFQHDGIKTALNGFVDAQAKYTKAAADAGMQSMMSLGMIFTSKDFYTEMGDQFKAMVPAFNVKKAKAK